VKAGRPVRPRTTAELKSAEEHAAVYAAVVASAIDAVIVIDDTGAVVAINPAAEKMFGYVLHEAQGRPIGELIVPEHLKAAHEAGFARYRSTGEARVLGRRVEMEARRKDGSHIPVELAITEVKLPDRRLFTANLRDLSAAREAAAEIERQRDALHQSEKLAALGSLLAGVAHELNNPLSIVLGQSTMLREEAELRADGESLLARARRIEAAADRCARVVRSFLAIARQRKVEARAVPLAPILDAAIDLMMYGLNSGGITVVRDYESGLPPVMADPDQVQQIVVNLLVNAAQALEEVEGPRRIVFSAAKSGDTLRLVVSDNGPGVPSDHATRIFEPFFTTKPQGTGTGIGLSVSRGLAESQGGTLTLRPPEDGGGAAFELRLPIAGKPPANGRANGTRRRRRSPEPERVLRALVVDDETEIATMLSEIMQNAGYACDVAASGRQAQELVAANGPVYDAVLCDLRMADIDGAALFRWLVANHPALAERTLFVTGDALGPAAGRFLAESRRPVLEKPFAPADVVRLVTGFTPRDPARNN
jgi:PAS domain S-box-containing protein